MVKRKRDYARGAVVFPSDFPARLERLRVAAGLTWRQFVRRLGVDRNTVRMWRKGRLPNAASMLALCAFANGVPSGLEILFGES